MEQSLAKKGQTDIVREGYFDLSPRSLSEAIQLAELMAKSELVPEQYRGKPGDVLIAVQYGAEVGIKPLQALQGIAVIKGRPVLWGDAALGVVHNSGLMENYKEMTFEEIEKAGKAVFWAKRKGTPEPIIREFSIEDAKRANLWGRKNRDGSPGVWCQYPYRMLQMRARAFALRDGFADALKGMAIREEVEDIEISEAPQLLAMPRRMSERQIEAPKENEPIGDSQTPVQTTERQEPPSEGFAKGKDSANDVISDAQVKRAYAVGQGTKSEPKDEAKVFSEDQIHEMCLALGFENVTKVRKGKSYNILCQALKDGSPADFKIIIDYLKKWAEVNKEG